MPKKLLPSALVPTLVQERLTVWGRCIHVQRLQQRITVADLCHRLGISEPTLRRVERGDPGVGAGAYLNALLVLGIADEATPALRPALWQTAPGRRVRPTQQEKGITSGADDYF
jgi:transcriptional regulator with XRE-family HTH domain